MKKEHSIRKRSAFFIFGILTVFSIFYGIICAIFFIYNYSNIKSINNSIVMEHHKRLDENLYNTQQYVINIYANNTNFRMLVQENSNTYNIYSRSKELRTVFESKTALADEHFGYFVCKELKNSYYSAYPSDFSSDLITSTDRIVKNHLKNLPSNGIWYVVPSDNGDTYLILSYRRGNTTVGALLDLNLYAETFNSATAGLVFTCADTYLTEFTDTAIQKSLTQRSSLPHYLISQTGNWQVTFGSYAYDTADFGILAVVPQYQLISLLRFLIFVFIIFLGILLLIVICFEKMFYGAIIFPIQQMSQMEKELSATISGEPFKINSDIIEYNQINRQIHSLINQVAVLQKEYHKKEMAYQHSQLQYYQLQTEPHFFLNCLKNVYAMAENKQFEKIKYMVTVISKHFRYVFRSNTWNISLKEELNETDCYFQLCQFSSTVPMLLEISADESLLSSLVPPLLIQTFVENSIKYGKQANRVLRIRVEVKLSPIAEDIEQQQDICILITDDGVGYSNDIINAVGKRHFPENGHIGIKNVIDRINLLYEGRAQFYIRNNETGGARTEIHIPLLTEQASLEEEYERTYFG